MEGSTIISWNNIYLDLVRKIGGAPGPLSRIDGLMHWAMYEAINRLTPNTEAYQALREASQVDSAGSRKGGKAKGVGNGKLGDAAMGAAGSPPT